MSTKTSSLEAAARDEMGENGFHRVESGAIFGEDTAARQLDLLRGDDGKLPSNVFQLVRQEASENAGPGRRKGSRNKRSTDLAKLLASKYPDPVQYMAGLYAMPLDQLCEALLVADGTIERRERLDEMLTELAGRVRELSLRHQSDIGGQSIERLAEACEALEAVANRGAAKPGEVAIKALNIQLAAAKAVSEYWHSKKPVEAKVAFENLPTIVMPGGGLGGFGEVDEATRLAGDVLARALSRGEITSADIVDLKLVDGRFTVDGEEVDTDEGDDGAGNG